MGYPWPLHFFFYLRILSSLPSLLFILYAYRSYNLVFKKCSGIRMERGEAAAALTTVEVVGLDDPLRVLWYTGTFNLAEKKDKNMHTANSTAKTRQKITVHLWAKINSPRIGTEEFFNFTVSGPISICWPRRFQEHPVLTQMMLFLLVPLLLRALIYND